MRNIYAMFVDIATNQKDLYGFCASGLVMLVDNWSWIAGLILFGLQVAVSVKRLRNKGE